jgi:hypothetical protein
MGVATVVVLTAVVVVAAVVTVAGAAVVTVVGAAVVTVVGAAVVGAAVVGSNAGVGASGGIVAAATPEIDSVANDALSTSTAERLR